MAQKCSQAPQKRKEEEEEEEEEKKEDEKEEEETKEEKEKEEEDALPYYKTGAKSKHFSQLVPPLLVSLCVLTPNFWQQ